MHNIYVNNSAPLLIQIIADTRMMTMIVSALDLTMLRKIPGYMAKNGRMIVNMNWEGYSITSISLEIPGDLIMCIKNQNDVSQGSTHFQISSSHLKIIGARRLASSKLHAEKPQISGATTTNIVASVPWHLGFMHP